MDDAKGYALPALEVGHPAEGSTLRGTIRSAVSTIPIGLYRRQTMAEFDPLGSAWRKSSASGLSNCVEARWAEDVQVRDSKEPQGPRLAFGSRSWGVFLKRTGHAEH